MFIVDTILSAINTVLDKVIPDANVREQVKSQLATQALDWYRLEVTDRESARRREADTKDTTVRELAWIYTIGYFGMLTGLLLGFVNIPPAQMSLLDVLMGVLTAGQYSIMAYYFGSSAGSAHKDSTLSTMIKNGTH